MIRMFVWIIILFGGAAFGLYLDNILFDISIQIFFSM